MSRTAKYDPHLDDFEDEPEPHPFGVELTQEEFEAVFDKEEVEAELSGNYQHLHDKYCSGVHWMEDTYGNEIRIQCGCFCKKCSEY